MDEILQTEESLSQLPEDPYQLKYGTVCINNYKALTPKANFTIFLSL